MEKCVGVKKDNTEGRRQGRWDEGGERGGRWTGWWWWWLAESKCQVQLYFWARLEPTRMRWKCDQLRTTSLRTTEASVHKCNGDKSVHDLTLPLSLGLLCAQADSGMHHC